jgi:hypothetical protein
VVCQILFGNITFLLVSVFHFKRILNSNENLSKPFPTPKFFSRFTCFLFYFNFKNYQQAEKHFVILQANLSSNIAASKGRAKQLIAISLHLKFDFNSFDCCFSLQGLNFFAT